MSVSPMLLLLRWRGSSRSWYVRYVAGRERKALADRRREVEEVESCNPDW